MKNPRHKDLLHFWQTDYEQSLFFLSPSNKTRENAHARDWRRETGKARKKERQSLFFLLGLPPSFLASRGLAARRSLSYARG